MDSVALRKDFGFSKIPNAWKKHGRVEGLLLRGGKTLKVLEWQDGRIVDLQVE